MSIDIPAGQLPVGSKPTAVSAPISAHPEIAAIAEHAQTVPSLKPLDDVKSYLLADRVDIGRPLLDQPVEKVETCRP